VSNPKSKPFLESVRNHPDFELEQELAAFVERYGVSLALLQAIIDAKILTKDEACKLWGDSLGVAYVDPFTSVLTDEAIACVPAEIARKPRRFLSTFSTAFSLSPSRRRWRPS